MRDGSPMTNRIERGRGAWGRFALLALALLAGAIAAHAEAHSNGFLFVAPGVASGNGHTEAAWNAGVGGEGVFLRHFGLGAELGALRVGGDVGNLYGLVSLNGLAHFGASGKTDPFVTMGYSSLFQITGQNSFINFGGGVNYWFAPRLGLKLEFLDHARSGSGLTNLATFRFGIAFH